MTYALRKLIAFVFLGGLFWFVYQDLDNLGEDWFMHALGLITVVFALFWLFIPMVVVWTRRRRRVRRNRERYEKWLSEGGAGSVRARRADGGRTAKVASIGVGDVIFFHEKGTLYSELGKLSPEDAKHVQGPVGRPSDVAFPRFRRMCRVEQRTHCYFTSRGVAFAGKDLDFAVPFAELKSLQVEPGGLVFEAARGGRSERYAFTFQNPLVAADMLELARNDGVAASGGI